MQECPFITIEEGRVFRDRADNSVHDENDGTHDAKYGWTYTERRVGNFLLTLHDGERVIIGKAFQGGLYDKPSRYICTNFGNCAIWKKCDGTGRVFDKSETPLPEQSLIEIFSHIDELRNDNIALLNRIIELIAGKKARHDTEIPMVFPSFISQSAPKVDGKEITSFSKFAEDAILSFAEGLRRMFDEQLEKHQTRLLMEKRKLEEDFAHKIAHEKQQLALMYKRILIEKAILSREKKELELRNSESRDGRMDAVIADLEKICSEPKLYEK